MEQYEQALPLVERSLVISEKLLGKHPDTATVLENVASLYEEMGRHEEAEPLRHRARTIREKFAR